MLSILHVVYDSDYKISEQIRYLEACNQLGTFGGESAKDIENAEKKIKALLSIPGSARTSGLLLLHTLLPQCSSQVFLENSESWSQLLLKVLQGKDKVSDKRLAIKIFCSLIPYLNSFPQLWKKSSASLIPPLLEIILKLIPEDEWFSEALELLSICMCHFPGPCGPFKHRIEAFFIKHLDSWNGKTSECIATCVAYLPACGGGGSQGVNHSTAWSEQANQIISCLNQLLDFIYEGVDISDDCPAIIFSSVELPPLQSADPIRAFFSAWHRYEILSLCLIKMLSTEFPVAVKIPAGNILSFACKVFSVNCTVMAKKSSLDCATIASIIPALHCITFNILEALIFSCRKRLITHAATINKLFLQTLKWTKNDGNYYGTSKPYSILRRIAYQTLLVWLQVLGSCSHIGPHADPLLQQILLDITPESDVVQLQTKSATSSHFDKQKTKMKKKGLVFLEHKQGDCTFRKIDLQSCQKTCVEALGVLKYVLYTSGSILKPDLHKQIHSVVIDQLLYLQQGKDLSASPYSSTECQKELYAVLLSCVLNPSPYWPPPLQPAVRIFSSGQVNKNIQISSFCLEAFAVCNTIIHPKVAVMDYSVHRTSPPSGSVSAASEAESVTEPASQLRKAIFGQSGSTHVLPEKEEPRPPNASQPEMAHFEALHHAKRQPKQEDVVMLSENESERYSDDEASNRYEEKREENKPTDFAPVSQQQAGFSRPNTNPEQVQVPKANVESKPPVQQKSNDPVVMPRAVPLPKSVAIQKALAAQKQLADSKRFADAYQEECEVSEDEAELIETEEDEEGDYDDEEEAAEADEEYEMEDYGQEEEYEDVGKRKGETREPNGIQVSSTTPKRPVVEEYEIVESEENDNNEDVPEHSTSRPDSKLNEPAEDQESCMVVDLSESPEKARELQTGGGPHSEAPQLEENCQDDQMVLIPIIESYSGAATVEDEYPKENHTDVESILPDQEVSIIPELIEHQYVMKLIKPEIHEVLETVVSAVSRERDMPTTSLTEAVADINGCDTTFHLHQKKHPIQDSQRTEHTFNDCVVIVATDSQQQNDTVSESHAGNAEDCVSTSDDKSNGTKHSLVDDDDACVEDDHVSKKQCREEDNDRSEAGEPLTAMVASFVPEECDGNEQEQPINSVLASFVPGECDSN